MRSLVAYVAASAAILLATPGFAQRSADPAPVAQDSKSLSVEDRAQQLKAVAARVTSPDRDLNIANFEQIMESGDARRIEIAIRTLVASDDAVLRGMAMRGYIAVTRELILEAVLSQADMTTLTAARAQQNGINSLKSPNLHLREMSAVGFKFPIAFEITSIKEPRGKVFLRSGNNNNAVYSVRGERITFGLAAAPGWHRCEFDLAPRKDATIAGTITCPHPSFMGRPIAVVAPMF